MQCGRFGSDPSSVAVLTKCSVDILGVAILECGRFDQDPCKWCTNWGRILKFPKNKMMGPIPSAAGPVKIMACGSQGLVKK